MGDAPPLRPTPVALDDLTALHQVICRLEQPWCPPYPNADDRYGWEPLPLSLFLAGMASAKAAFVKCHGHFNARFLDVGCGIGTKMLLAFHLGWRVSGIDIHEPYIEVAKALCPEAEMIEVTDARTWNGYEMFDLLYCYSPLRDGSAQASLIETLQGQMKPEALLLTPEGLWKSA